MITKPTAEHSGVYRAPAELDVLRSALEREGALWREIDLSAAKSKADLLAVLAHALEFPPHFGDNWDALEDCLQDLPEAGRGIALHLLGGTHARRRLGNDWATLLEILADAATYWKTRRRMFI